MGARPDAWWTDRSTDAPRRQPPVTRWSNSPRLAPSSHAANSASVNRSVGAGAAVLGVADLDHAFVAALLDAASARVAAAGRLDPRGVAHPGLQSLIEIDLDAMRSKTYVLRAILVTLEVARTERHLHMGDRWVLLVGGIEQGADPPVRDQAGREREDAHLDMRMLRR